MYASFCKLGCLGKTYVIVSRRNMRTPNSPVPTRVRWYYACDRHSGGNNTEESIGCSLRMERSFNFWLAFERGIARQNPSWYPWFMRSFGVWLLITALDRLAQQDERQSQIVEMKFFGGLSIEDIAEVLKLSPRTVRRDWTVARAWLHKEIKR
ncbi:MAG: hypothetical protein DMG54_23385 [Acidobacteria bacterium]|nr:MAG: hypothetical protein DMG54_23385 [Acidobacteriota bacterium]